MMKFKKHGFVLLPAVLSIFILGLLGVSLASIYSDTFATLSAGKAASSAQQFAQIEAEYLKTLGFDEAATGKHTWNTMEKFVGDADGKEWESQVEHVRHMQVSEDNAVDIYKISVRKKGDKTSAYSVEIPLSSQSGSNNFSPGIIFPWVSNTTSPQNALECNGSTFSATEYPKLYDLLGSTTLPDLRDRTLQGANTALNIIEAGLPNITGSFYSYHGHSGYSEGAFYTPYGEVSHLDGGAYWFCNRGYIYFDASNSNAIYGKSTTVQPPAITVRWFIQAK